MKIMPIIRAKTENAAFIAWTDITKPKPTAKKHAAQFRKNRMIAGFRTKTASITHASNRLNATMHTNASQPNARPIAEERLPVQIHANQTQKSVAAIRAFHAKAYCFATKEHAWTHASPIHYAPQKTRIKRPIARI